MSNLLKEDQLKKIAEDNMKLHKCSEIYVSEDGCVFKTEKVSFGRSYVISKGSMKLLKFTLDSPVEKTSKKNKK